MKTKPMALAVAVFSSLLSLLSQSDAFLIPPAIFISHFTYGIIKSRLSGRSTLNEAPNSFRILLASIGGIILLNPASFILPSLGIILIAGSIVLNDEYQRRVFDSLRKGRRGGSIALLGIDGSGKSTHSIALKSYLIEKGYHCSIVPFHRYLFLERLPRKKGSSTKGRRGNPIRPLLSLVDNLLLLVITSIGKGMEGRIIIYDRFIWSTYIKYEALGYPVRPLRFFYLLPKPKLAIILDVPLDRSIKVISSRFEHIRYREETLKREKDQYVKIAQANGYPIIDSTRNFEDVEIEIEKEVARAFKFNGAI